MTAEITWGIRVDNHPVLILCGMKHLDLLFRSVTNNSVSCQFDGGDEESDSGPLD